MKRILLPLFLLISTLPLLANDEGGDGPYIPNYMVLSREGYASAPGYFGGVGTVKAAPKPTQAYYANGYTVYYGYTPVPTRTPQVNLQYAFGYPVDYFRQMMPVTVNETNLDRYAVEMVKPGNRGGGSSPYEPGTMVAKTRTTTSNVAGTTATTRTKTQTAAGGTTATLPAIGEKPSH